MEDLHGFGIQKVPDNPLCGLTPWAPDLRVAFVHCLVLPELWYRNRVSPLISPLNYIYLKRLRGSRPAQRVKPNGGSAADLSSIISARDRQATRTVTREKYTFSIAQMATAYLGLSDYFRHCPPGLDPNQTSPKGETRPILSHSGSAVSLDLLDGFYWGRNLTGQNW
jgi:hypothetical protein